jgi:hypothetical protein
MKGGAISVSLYCRHYCNCSGLIYWGLWHSPLRTSTPFYSLPYKRLPNAWYHESLLSDPQRTSEGTRETNSPGAIVELQSLCFQAMNIFYSSFIRHRPFFALLSGHLSPTSGASDGLTQGPRGANIHNHQWSKCFQHCARLQLAHAVWTFMWQYCPPPSSIASINSCY